MRREYGSTGVIFCLFFLSGLASLANEVVWFKYLNLTFGATTAATATLLAVFMAGLAIGSSFGGKVAVRLKRPALAYAALEAGVGVFALATPLLFQLIDRGYVFSYRHIGHGAATLTAIRIVLSAGALIVPTICMGATFPVLARQVERDDAAGRNSGWLYGINTAGAVTGTMLTGFWTIPVVGLHATLLASACVSLLAALIASLIPAVSTAPAPEKVRWNPGTLWLLVAFAGGLAAMGVEVLWTRILVLDLGSSVYSFALMLAIYLTGVAAGSLAGAAATRGDPARSLFRAQASLGVVILLQVFAFLLFTKATILVGFNILHARTFLDLLITHLVVTAAYLLPPTFLMGWSFAMLLKITAHSAGRAPQSAGVIYAANTGGGILGALGAGFAAIPTIGTQNALLACGLIALLLAVAIIPRSTMAKVLVILFAVGGFLAPRHGVLLSAGVFAGSPAKDLLDFEEGVTATVAVKRYEKPSPWLSLELNGVNVAGTSPDLIVTQKLQAHLPLALADVPRSVLHIGFGSGGTAWSVSLHDVSHIRVVEISPEVITTSGRFFRMVNHGVLGDPRVAVTINDGRNFLLATSQKFDAILSDSIHPRYPGNGSLYTEDYFRLCARRLAPGGVISMWLPMYSLTPENYKEIVRAFSEVFPNTSIWYPHEVPNAFTIVLATPRPEISVARFARRLSSSKIEGDLARIGDADPMSVLSDFMMGPEDVRRWVSQTPPHTDDLPVVEYESGRTLLYYGTWARTFADLVAHRSRLGGFVRDANSADPLWQDANERFRKAFPLLERHLARVEREALENP